MQEDKSVDPSNLLDRQKECQLARELIEKMIQTCQGWYIQETPHSERGQMYAYLPSSGTLNITYDHTDGVYAYVENDRRKENIQKVSIYLGLVDECVSIRALLQRKIEETINGNEPLVHYEHVMHLMEHSDGWEDKSSQEYDSRNLWALTQEREGKKYHYVVSMEQLTSSNREDVQLRVGLSRMCPFRGKVLVYELHEDPKVSVMEKWLEEERLAIEKNPDGVEEKERKKKWSREKEKLRKLVQAQTECIGQYDIILNSDQIESFKMCQPLIQKLGGVRNPMTKSVQEWINKVTQMDHKTGASMEQWLLDKESNSVNIKGKRVRL